MHLFQVTCAINGAAETQWRHEAGLRVCPHISGYIQACSCICLFLANQETCDVGGDPLTRRAPLASGHLFLSHSEMSQ